MKPVFENIPLIKNEDKRRFEIEINGKYTFTNYGEALIPCYSNADT